MKSENCPICNNSSKPEYIPFCSKRCSQIDLNRWLGEKYQININDDDKAKLNSKNRILASLETDLVKMVDDENERLQFKQRVITFLNNESAKWG